VAAVDVPVVAVVKELAGVMVGVTELVLEELVLTLVDADEEDPIVAVAAKALIAAVTPGLFENAIPGLLSLI
jgi:hypothetical protein